MLVTKCLMSIKGENKQVFCYDMNNSAQSRQYFVKLAEYGIDYREWQNIIKKINEEESGLSKLFAECKDEKGLVENGSSMLWKIN